MMENTNEMTIIFDSRPVNEALARVAVASFCTQLNPTLEEISDLKTAVSEAVTNCIIHGYEGEIHKIRVWNPVQRWNLFTKRSIRVRERRFL